VVTGHFGLRTLRTQDISDLKKVVTEMSRDGSGSEVSGRPIGFVVDTALLHIAHRPSTLVYANGKKNVRPI